MRITARFIPIGLIATLALATLPVMAEDAVPTLYGAQGSVTAVALHDSNHNGQVDRVRMTLDNSAHRTWVTHGTAGLRLTRYSNDIAIARAYVSSPPGAQPATLELMLDESDTDLPSSTSGEGFELSYVPQGLGNGVDDGLTELSAIAEGDTDAHDTEIDMAPPVLLASDPVAGQYRVLRNRPIILTFSETIAQDTMTYASANNPGGWSVTWSSDGTTATLNHDLYRVVVESFTVTTANDLAGNALVADSYPNPFTFETTSVNDTQTPDQPNPVLAITRPAQLDTLEVGMPNLINWYTNEAEAGFVRLSYSKDGGVTFQTIASRTASEGVYTWYPPNLPGSLILKAESLTSAGAILNILTVNPLSLVLPSPMQSPFAITGPSVTDITDTTATVTMTLNMPATALDLVCNGAKLASADVPMTSPADIAIGLTALTKGSSNNCHFEMLDLFGRASTITIPAFIASSAGDVTAPYIVGIPKVDEFDAIAGTARLNWTTDEPTTAHIDYGIYLNYGKFIDITTRGTTHTAFLTDLTPGELHQARVTMTDTAGNAAVTDDIWFVFLRDGDLVKSKDDSAVYWYKDAKRNVFPNATVYRSWFGDDFSDVLTIPKTQLGTIQLGKNVKVKANTFLVKITSDPKTYAVEPDGTLRWIRTEVMARTLYGAAWNTLVRDIDVSLFVDYAIGAPLADGEVPVGYAHN